MGLLPQPGRSAGNLRLYDQAARDRLAFFRHARDLGFPLDDIRALLSLSDRPDMSCAAADVIASRQLVAARCAHGTISDCKVIEVLGDHAHCLHADHDEDSHFSLAGNES